MDSDFRAFPLDTEGFANQGLTARDYFAAKALQGMVAASFCNQAAEDMMKKAGIDVTKDVPNFFGMIAYDFADAMIEERNKR